MLRRFPHVRSALAAIYCLVVFGLWSEASAQAQVSYPPASSCDATCAYNQAQSAIAINLSGPLNMAAGSEVNGVPIATGNDISAALGSYTPSSGLPALIASNAPVQSVNSQTGAVTVPIIVRQFGTGTPSNTTGAVSWTFASTPAFTSAPYCFTSVSSTNTNYVFLVRQTAISTSSVSFTVLAAATTLNISLGALTVWGPPPTGTTIGILCIAAP